MISNLRPTVMIKKTDSSQALLSLLSVPSFLIKSSQMLCICFQRRSLWIQNKLQLLQFLFLDKIQISIFYCAICTQVCFADVIQLTGPRVENTQNRPSSKYTIYKIFQVEACSGKICPNCSKVQNNVYMKETSE